MAVDRFAIYGWMSGYYRQVANASGVLDLSPDARWTILRAKIMTDHPVNGRGRAEAIDGVPESERPHVLAWLETFQHWAESSNKAA